MESDRVVTIGKSVIQHGYFNDRIYLMKVYPEDRVKIKWYITVLRAIYQYSKIVMKIPKNLENFFKTKNTVHEATIPNFYLSGDDALFLSRFFSHSRESDDRYYERKKTIQSLSKKKSEQSSKRILPSLMIRRASMEDVLPICVLYQKTFETYPFPIHDADYLKKIMSDGVVFFVGEISGEIIAAASCEIDYEAAAVEMTDFAIDSRYQGYGLSKKILVHMEEHMKLEGICTAYTICRSLPVPINRLFFGAGYQLGGTLINNTNICGTIESMNVWYKKLYE
jgi:putative beta-lysine N-acetyltransferase